MGSTPRSLACALAAALACAPACGKKTTFADAAPTPDAPRPDAAILDPAGEFPPTIDLGAGDCGGTKTATFTVQNIGGSDLTYSITSDNAAFSVAPASGAIIAGTSTTFTVTAQVDASSTLGLVISGNLSVTTNIPDATSVTVPVRVHASGAVVNITSATIGFGDVETGATATRALNVSNAGDQAFTITTGTPTAAGFTVSWTGAPGPTSVAPSQSLPGAQATFSPTSTGGANATAALTYGGNLCGNAPPSSFALSGTGVPPGSILVQNVPVDFSAVLCGAAAGTATITLVNNTSATATYTANFLADAEGDEALYGVSPSSGSIGAGGNATVTVTRKVIALPATPRAYDAVLRIRTSGQTSVNHDVDIKQTLTGPFLVVDTTTRNFGWRPNGSSAILNVNVGNTGNASASLTATGLSAPLSSVLPMPIPGGDSGDLGVRFQPTTDGQVVAGTVQVGATGACSSPTNVSITSGTGPYLVFSTTPFVATCQGAVQQPQLRGKARPGVSGIVRSVDITNLGNVDGNVSTCVETTGNFDVQVFGTPKTVIAGSGASITAVAGFGHSGTVTGNLGCTVDEPAEPVKDLALTRNLTGADFVLTAETGSGAPAAFDFNCPDAPTATVVMRVENQGNGGAVIFPVFDLQYPLGEDSSTDFVAPGSASTGNGAFLDFGGSGTNANGLCDQPGNPGDLLFTGSIGISPTGSGGICTVTPPSLPVRLFK